MRAFVGDSTITSGRAIASLYLAPATRTVRAARPRPCRDPAATLPRPDVGGSRHASGASIRPRNGPDPTWVDPDITAVLESTHVDAWDPAYAVVAAGLAANRAEVSATALTGGVSCDTYRVEVPGDTFVVKRALPRLRVADEWYAPVERNTGEVEYFRLVGDIAPGQVPEIVVHVPPATAGESGWFAMTWFPPERYPLWKAQLAGGTASADTGRAVGDLTGRIHAATAGREDVRAQFATEVHRDTFHAKRIDAYLLTTAARHHEVERPLRTLAADLGRADVALMHGDLSPKNVLVGDEGPVLLDAEACCWGDPAFDVAFCLNHLLLKCAWKPEHTPLYRQSYTGLWNAYRARIDWEPPDQTGRRIAALLPGLLLARVDGKSPVEYLTGEDASATRQLVRTCAVGLVLDPPDTVPEVLAAFLGGIQAGA